MPSHSMKNEIMRETELELAAVVVIAVNQGYPSLVFWLEEVQLIIKLGKFIILYFSLVDSLELNGVTYEQTGSILSYGLRNGWSRS